MRQFIWGRVCSKLARGQETEEEEEELVSLHLPPSFERVRGIPPSPLSSSTPH